MFDVLQLQTDVLDAVSKTGLYCGIFQILENSEGLAKSDGCSTSWI